MAGYNSSHSLLHGVPVPPCKKRGTRMNRIRRYACVDMHANIDRQLKTLHCSLLLICT